MALSMNRVQNNIYTCMHLADTSAKRLTLHSRSYQFMHSMGIEPFSLETLINVVYYKDSTFLVLCTGGDR